MYSQLTTSLTRNDEPAVLIGTVSMPTDLMELRLIESYQLDGRQHSRLVDRLFLESADIIHHDNELRAANRAGANIYFGINPRSSKNGTKSAVALCRTLWMDLDHVSPAESHRWAMLPLPTVTVSSGHGVHLYWRLTSPVSVKTCEERAEVESLLRGMSKAAGGDFTQDVTRLLRLPGYYNVKDLRNGERRRPCRIVECEPNRLYPLAAFDAWRHKQEEMEATPWTDVAPPIRKISGTRATRRIRGLVAYLDRDVPDRSTRDFAVVCGLIRSGLAPDEIWHMVQGRSKFETNGRPYFDHTIEAAMNAVFGHK